MNLKACYRPLTLKEALDYLEEYKDKSKIIAGGTDLIIKLRKGNINPQVLIDISFINELKGVLEVGEYMEIGCGTTFYDLASCILLNERLKGLKDAARSIGSPQIRNRGTIGGNICNASPAADSVVPLLALDSILTLESKKGKRKIYLKDFFKDKGKTDIRDDEILTTIKFKTPTKNQGLGFYKLGLRKSLAISRISFSVFLEIDDINRIEIIRVASGSVGKFPMREYKIENYLTGRILDEDTLNTALEILEKDIYERLNGRNTARFKSIAAKGVFKKALLKALCLAKGGGKIED